MTNLIEGRATVSFDPTWTAVKWDDTDAYRYGVQRVQAHRAVDMAAVSGTLVTLIELKDYANPTMSAQDRLRLLRSFSSERLARQIAQKVADSLSGLQWSHPRRGIRSAEVEGVANALRDAATALAVIVIAEHDAALAPEISALSALLRRELDWLPPTTTVVVTDSARTWPLPASSLAVTP